MVLSGQRLVRKSMKRHLSTLRIRLEGLRLHAVVRQEPCRKSMDLPLKVNFTNFKLIGIDDVDFKSTCGAAADLQSLFREAFQTNFQRNFSEQPMGSIASFSQVTDNEYTQAHQMLQHLATKHSSI